MNEQEGQRTTTGPRAVYLAESGKPRGSERQPASISVGSYWMTFPDGPKYSERKVWLSIASLALLIREWVIRANTTRGTVGDLARQREHHYRAQHDELQLRGCKWNAFTDVGRRSVRKGKRGDEQRTFLRVEEHIEPKKRIRYKEGMLVLLRLKFLMTMLFIKANRWSRKRKSWVTDISYLVQKVEDVIVKYLI